MYSYYWYFQYPDHTKQLVHDEGVPFQDAGNGANYTGAETCVLENWRHEYPEYPAPETDQEWLDEHHPDLEHMELDIPNSCGVRIELSTLGGDSDEDTMRESVQVGDTLIDAAVDDSYCDGIRDEELLDTSIITAQIHYSSANSL